MAIVNVKNLKGTADNSPPYGYGSWVDFWSSKKGVTPTFCRKCGTSGTIINDIVGAHVKKVAAGNEWYITPLCRPCNMSDDEFLVNEEHLVPVS